MLRHPGLVMQNVLCQSAQHTPASQITFDTGINHGRCQQPRPFCLVCPCKSCSTPDTAACQPCNVQLATFAACLLGGVHHEETPGRAHIFGDLLTRVVVASRAYQEYCSIRNVVQRLMAIRHWLSWVAFTSTWGVVSGTWFWKAQSLPLCPKKILGDAAPMRGQQPPVSGQATPGQPTPHQLMQQQLIQQRQQQQRDLMAQGLPAASTPAPAPTRRPTRGRGRVSPTCSHMLVSAPSPAAWPANQCQA